MKRIIVLTLVVLLSSSVKSQLIENYGLRISTGFSNQYWEYSKNFSEMTEWKDFKSGFSIYLNTTSRINDYLFLRPEIGYIQKGFKEDIVINSSTRQYEFNNQKLILHNASANIGLLIYPLEKSFKPFVSLGLRGDYILDYKDIRLSSDEFELSYFDSFLEGYNKLSLGAFFGFGIELKEKIYIEMEYNPSITNIVKYPVYSIRDHYWGLYLGFNINKLVK